MSTKNFDRDLIALLPTVDNSRFELNNSECSKVKNISKDIIKCLSDYRINETIFNSYVYNQVEVSNSRKEPLVKKEELKNENTSETNEEVKTEELSLENILYYNYLIKISHTHLVEILFILSTLLSGKRKSELQAKLLAKGFLNTLKNLFNKIKWTKLPIDVPSRNRSDTALKIQLLRFIYNLTSKDEWSLCNKFWFVSREEVEILLWYFILKTTSDEIRVFMTDHYLNFKVHLNKPLKKFYGFLKEMLVPEYSAFKEMYASSQPITLSHYLFR